MEVRVEVEGFDLICFGKAGAFLEKVQRFAPGKMEWK
jgi:hypothetical protein